MLLDAPAAAARDLLAGICAAADGSDIDPAVGFSIALAFDALVDPVDPPPPWQPQPVTDPLAATRQAYEQVSGLLHPDRPVTELLALAQSARHLSEALHRAAAAEGALG